MTRNQSFMPLLDRLGDKFTVGDECWLWHGAKTAGYGSIRIDGKAQYAHRVLYELLIGPIPEGTELDHLCRVTNCVRPAHLEPVSHQENVRRGTARTNGADHRAKTHCVHGHPLSGENVYMPPGTHTRQCRECKRVGSRAWKARNR